MQLRLSMLSWSRPLRRGAKGARASSAAIWSPFHASLVAARAIGTVAKCLGQLLDSAGQKSRPQAGLAGGLPGQRARLLRG
jgi:hypothetical protein